METKKPSTEEDSNSLVLDKIEILANIGVDKMYTTGDGVTIRKWEGEENTDLFIADINKNNIKFLGVLNSKLQKDNYGVLTYPNGEKYFGLFQKELRTKQGFYEYSPKIIGDKIAIIKNKKEASIKEIEDKINSKVQSALSKIANFSFN